MITNEIIQRVQSLYSKGVESDDSRLTPRHIYNKMVTSRSRLLSQKAKKRQRINQWNYQTIPCIELEKVPKHECPCVPPLGCSIYRTKEKLPKPIMAMDKALIDSVTTIDGSQVFNEIGWVEAKYKSGNRYTSNKPDYFIRNEYLYIIQKKGATVIAVTGIFEDPADAYAYPSVCDQDCNDCAQCDSPLDLEFPIDEDLIDTLVEMCVNELVILFSQARMDETANSSDEAIRVVPPRQRQQYRDE